MGVSEVELVWRAVVLATEAVVSAVSPGVSVDVALPTDLLLLLLTVTEVKVEIAAVLAGTETDTMAECVKPGVSGCVSREARSVC